MFSGCDRKYKELEKPYVKRDVEKVKDKTYDELMEIAKEYGVEIEEDENLRNNPDLYKKVLTGKILCLPKTIGSTTGGLVIQTVCSMGIAPAAMLFSETIDSLAASGIILAKNWENSKIIAIDELGKGFLNAVNTGDTITIEEDGTVIIG